MVDHTVYCMRMDGLKDGYEYVMNDQKRSE